MKKENTLMWFGSIMAVVAVFVPFAIIYLTKTPYAMKSFEKLGTIGDFFGGTTVGLLSLASIIFVTAAIIMQKEELKLQREEVKKTREEYEVTNATMKRQQFDSTFFNMINLHHKIVSEIEYNDNKGRSVHKLFHERLNNSYNNEVLEKYTEELVDRIFKDGNGSAIKFAEDTYLWNKEQEYINQKKQTTTRKITLLVDVEKIVAEAASENLQKEKENEKINQWRRENFILQFKEKSSEDNDFIYKTLLKADFKLLLDKGVENNYVQIFKKDFLENPLRNLKNLAFELTYNEFEKSLGHYFKNFYRIIKIIHDETFHDDPITNENERQKYRGILRDQLSSIELIVIFYNTVYTKKSENFRGYFANTNFLEGHLVETDYLWANDDKELVRLSKGNQ